MSSVDEEEEQESSADNRRQKNSRATRKKVSIAAPRVSQADKEKMEQEIDRVRSIEVKDGNYQVLVHVIQARNMSSNAFALLDSGVPDPAVTVTVNG